MPEQDSNAIRLEEYAICQRRGHSPVPKLPGSDPYEHCRYCGTVFRIVDVPRVIEQKNSRPDGADSNKDVLGI